MSWFDWPFDTTGFPPRWQCGSWSAELGWTHILSDGLIWLAYMAIPALFLFFTRRHDAPFPKLFWLFGAFIVACGTIHLVEVMIFWEPLYRLAAIVKLVAAAVSWITVLVLIPTLPQAFALQSSKDLEKGIETRTSQLEQANEMLQREVQERLRAEREIREQQKWLEVILRSIGDGIIATDAAGQIALFNPAAETLTGFTQEEAIGKPLNEILRTRRDGQANGIEKSWLLTGGSTLTRSMTEQVELIWRDGSVRIVELQLNPIRVDGTTVAGILLTLDDITDRKAAEESLRLRDRVISATNQGILIADATHNDLPIVYASAGFERITGYGADEVIGRNCRFLQGPSTDAEAVSRIRESLRQAVPCLVELINYRKDGTPFWNELSIAPVRDDRGRLTHFVGVQSDISQRKALEEKLQATQRLESVGRLAGGVAHDFNNMLTIINGCCDLALSESGSNESLKSLLSEIRAAGKRAAELTRQLLAFSRRQLISPQPLNLNDIVTDTEKMLERLLGEDIRLFVSLDPELELVLADRGQMQQVLINLAINARDAMPRGGDLRITTRNLHVDEQYARNHVDIRRRPYVVLEVIDSGEGLDDSNKARIFEPFFTTKLMGQGTGLGLAMVHSLVTQADGHIEVDSRRGIGTTFRVCLPRASACDVVRTQHDEPAVEPTSGSETILVVEDEQAVRSFLSSALSKYGYHVLSAPNAEGAIEIARTHSSPIHLLITDVVMPGGSGSALAREIAELHPETKLLYISGYTEDAILRSGVTYEDVNFLEKPFTARVLAEKVRAALGQ